MFELALSKATLSHHFRVLREAGLVRTRLDGRKRLLSLRIDDLDARFDLPPDLLGDLREHSILYDRDEHGEYLHFYTEMLGSRVFFEVVQRIPVDVPSRR